MPNLQKYYLNIHQKIELACKKAGRSVDSVHLLAVSKTQASSAIEALFQLGQHDFGENQVQEALAKMLKLKDLDITWHFIGAIQTNKTKAIAESFDWVHTVSRMQEALRLNDQRPSHKAPLNICLQLNIGNEMQKNGAQKEAILPLAEYIQVNCPRLRLRGLMCVPPIHPEYEIQLKFFEEMKALAAVLIQKGIPCDTLSMGMTEDMEAAIMAGSTCIRIGRGLFGERKYD